MRKLSAFLVGIGVGFCWATSGLGADHFVSLSGGNLAPFTSWDTAATNIQDAIDAGSAGDVVWVTNGVYAAGGKVMAGDLTNRVVLDKALTVQSVNGPFVTTIQGNLDPNTMTNGPLALRCAWLTNGASLIGFTLAGGGSRNLGTTATLQSGGGAWCASASSVLANCIIQGCAAYMGGGVYQGTVINSAVFNNRAVFSGGGGGTYNANLKNCTVLFNLEGGISGGAITNSIIFFNTSSRVKPFDNYSVGTFSYSCTTPLPSGPGNISTAPQVLGDSIHLASTSPCVATGTNLASGTDIDGQRWLSPPSMGCDQWQPQPSCPTRPTVQANVNSFGLTISAGVAGQEPFACWWFKDGAPLPNNGHFSNATTTNLWIFPLGPGDAGSYQIVASNAFGMGTSALAQVVIHCVDAVGTGPLPPYADWDTAATNIQDAVDAALPGDVVLVTNGVYATGGKIMAGDLLNRVAIDKPTTVLSVNGPATTLIAGTWDPNTTTGPLAVRCAWLTDGAVLSGFTLQHGATRALTTTPDAQQNGGDAWGTSTAAMLLHCSIESGAAGCSGAGACQLSLVNCKLKGNSTVGAGSFSTQFSGQGGGAFGCNLIGCIVTGNFANNNGGGVAYSSVVNSALTKNVALQYGGGVYNSTPLNCTITGNSVGGSLVQSQGGGAHSSKLTNCIVYGNLTATWPPSAATNYASCTLAYCCSAPAAAGPGNITADPLLLGDGLHLTTASPCRGAGTNIVVGTDIDGQPWANPPSIGCDEWQPAPALDGPPLITLTGFPPQLGLSCLAVGQAPFTYLWLKDNSLLQDGPKYSSTQTPNLTVNSFGPADAGAYQFVASNSFGVTTSAVAMVAVHCANAASPAPAPPYSHWSTAATNIQDAIDSAGPGEFVLVTNGIYSTGGRVMAGDLTNRVVVNKPLLVTSINGAPSTLIQGAYDPTTTNGPLAVRCAWVAQGASLRGFTLRGGATRNTGDTIALQSGGGAWCGSTNELLFSCILSNNAAASYGGGSYQGQLQRSILWGNSASRGGGAYSARLDSSLVRSNSASALGGGVYSSVVVNCTIIANQALISNGGGEFGSKAWNSIIFYNFAPGSFFQFYANDWDISSQSSLVSCWTSSANYPFSNTTPGPQFTADGFHLAASSPCRGTGNSLYSAGTDIDGEPWLSPPSIGCDEFYDSDFTGPLLVGPIIAYDLYTRGTPLRNGNNFVSTTVSGNADRIAWYFGDGVTRTNSFAFVTSHTWTNEGDFNVTFTAYNADNPTGVSTNGLIHVILPNRPKVSGPVFTGTNFTLTFSSQAGITYVVEQTSNLVPPVTWQTLTSVPGSVSGSPVAVADNSITNLTRFYRVRAL